jgi:hypothetical protein
MVKGKMLFFVILLIVFSAVDTKVRAYSYEDFSEIEQRYIMDTYESYDYINEEEFSYIKNLKLDKNGYTVTKLPKIESFCNINPSSVSISTPKKELIMTISNRTVEIFVNWKSVPNIKNYDVIGIRLSDGMKLTSEPVTKVITKKGTNYFNTNEYCKYSNNGVGTSVKLPTNTTNYIIKFMANFSGSGEVYGSYQHSVTNNNSLNDSKKYTITDSGFGRVFKFNNNIASRYDNMPGLHLRG